MQHACAQGRNVHHAVAVAQLVDRPHAQVRKPFQRKRHDFGQCCRPQTTRIAGRHGRDPLSHVDKGSLRGGAD